MEIWKDILGYEGIYQASNLGNIKNIIKGNILKSFYDGKGYYQTFLYKDGIRKCIKTHRIICNTFMRNIENKPEVNHKNGIKSDNKLENLEWCNAKENINHRIKILGIQSNFSLHNYNLGLKGGKHPKSKKVNQYDKQLNLIKQWDCITDITKTIGLDNSSIVKCCKGKLKTVGGFKWSYV